MSNPKEKNIYQAATPTADPTRANTTNGLTVSEMPSGGMTESASGEMSGLAETDMPRGAMTGGDDITSGSKGSEMPSGMTGAATANMSGLAVTDMPSGSMTESGGRTGASTSDAMPAGQMTGVAAGTMAGLTETEMPSGSMAQAQKSEQAGALPTLEITGEWRLSLSTSSLKTSAGS